MMNDNEIIKNSISSTPNDTVCLEKITYGQDSTGIPSVWISFNISTKRKKDLIKNINEFSNLLTNKLFRNGISVIPYIDFHSHR